MNKLHPWPTFLLAVLACLFTSCGDNTPTSSKTDSSTVLQEPGSTVEVSETTYALNLNESGHALRGFDAVEYRINGNAVEGKSEYQHDWSGAKWTFNSEDNRKLFIENPESYVPANGGFCTFGVVLSKKFDGDPSVWSVQNDKLYVFLNEEVKEKFFQDLDNNLAKVDDNWKLIRDKSPKELE